jgi:hypothetical protein
MTDPPASPNDSVGDGRRWARRITLALITLPSLLAIPNFLSCMAHSRVDSEVGVMMYGLPLAIGTMMGAPVVAVFALAWGLGMNKARRAGEPIPRWEIGCFGAIASLLAFLFIVFGSNFLHAAKSCAGI